MRTILVAGGGYAGFYTAWRLEKKLRRDEARIVVVDPRPGMVTCPLLFSTTAASNEYRVLHVLRNTKRPGVTNRHAARSQLMRPRE